MGIQRVGEIRADRPVLLVEIGNDWIKMIQAGPARRGVAVTRLHVEPFESLGAELTPLIDGVIRKQRFIRSPVILCIPRQAVIIRSLELPSIKPDEVADMLELQVGKQTPYSKDEIVFDYRFFEGSHEGYSRVLLAIAQRSYIRERLFILEEAGLEAARVSVSSEGVLNWYAATAGTGRTGADVVVDLDAGYADCLILDRGNVLFTRSLPVGALQVRDDKDRAIDKLAREVRQSLETCQAESPGVEPVRLVLTGAGARVPDMAPALGAAVGLPVEIVDSERSVTGWPAEPARDGDAIRWVSLTGLVGMALAPDALELHLLPDSVRLRRNLVNRASWLAALAMLVVSLVGVWCLWGLMKLTLAQQRLDRLRLQNAELAPVVERVGNMKRLVQSVERRRDPEFSAINMLSAVHPLVPDGVWLDTLDIQVADGRLVLAGTTATRQDVRDLVNAIEKSPWFKQAVEAGASRREESGRFRFQVQAAMEIQK